MADNQTKQQTATVAYNAPRPVNIGDVFYMIAQGETKQFYEPCKVCNDTHSVTVNGVTFGCPCCNRGRKQSLYNNTLSTDTACTAYRTKSRVTNGKRAKITTSNLAYIEKLDSVGVTTGIPNCGHAIFKKDSTPLAATVR